MAKAKKRKLHSNHADAKRKPTKPSGRPAKPQKPAKPSTKPPAPTIPFDPTSDRILLIGEGDFSFAKSIVQHHGCCDVTATCLDRKDELFQKYDPQAQAHTTYLEQEGQTVHYAVDATCLDKHKALLKDKQAGWDVIVFNFPHVGGKSKDVNRQVRFNQEMLVEFFRAAMAVLGPQGRIVVTLFEGEPYTLWNVRDLARHCGLEVKRSFRFEAEAYPGYRHARTLGNLEGGGGWKGEDREARSFVFGRKAGGVVGVKRKRGTRESEDEDEGG